MRTRKLRQFEKREKVVTLRMVEDFAAWLSTDTLPRPGYYVRTDDRSGWRYLDGETETTQAERSDRLEDIAEDVSLALGLHVEASGGEVEVRAQLLILP